MGLEARDVAMQLLLWVSWQGLHTTSAQQILQNLDQLLPIGDAVMCVWESRTHIDPAKHHVSQPYSHSAGDFFSTLDFCALCTRRAYMTWHSCITQTSCASQLPRRHADLMTGRAYRSLRAFIYNSLPGVEAVGKSPLPDHLLGQWTQNAF